MAVNAAHFSAVQLVRRVVAGPMPAIVRMAMMAIPVRRVVTPPMPRWRAVVWDTIPVSIAMKGAAAAICYRHDIRRLLIAEPHRYWCRVRRDTSKHQADPAEQRQRSYPHRFLPHLAMLQPYRPVAAIATQIEEANHRRYDGGYPAPATSDAQKV
jgi:hypothetical protein